MKPRLVEPIDDVRNALAHLHTRLTQMDGRKTEVKKARQAFGDLEKALIRALDLDPRREVLLGPADIARVRAELGLGSYP